MKKRLLNLLVVMAICIMLPCSIIGASAYEYNGIPLYVSKSALSVGVNGGTYTISVDSSSRSWYIQSESYSWLAVTKVDNYTIKISVNPNTTPLDARNGTITLELLNTSAANRTTSINISQSATTLRLPLDSDPRLYISCAFNVPTIGGLHRGVDFFYSEIGGKSVYASLPGVVIESNGSGSYGNHVKIQHANGVVTVYAHFRDLPLVKVGQNVSKGQKIGYVGKTGTSTGYHLHFEVQVNKNLVNPAKYLKW